MAFRRRACYVCGQVGHLAENCGSQERLCFNCGKGGHESSACMEPRTADQKSCYHCLAKGHIKADCPDFASRPRGGAAPAAAAAPAGNGAGGATSGCFTCGGPHLARSCPQAAGKPAASAQGLTCRNCGGQNHFARDCKAPPQPNAVRAAKPKTCYRCSEQGHIARDCPQFADAPAPQNIALVN